MLSKTQSDYMRLIFEIRLGVWTETGQTWGPEYVMVDHELAAINAIRSLLPGTRILTCFFHVMQAVRRWATSRVRRNLTRVRRVLYHSHIIIL